MSWKAVKDPLKSGQVALCQISGFNIAAFCLPLGWLLMEPLIGSQAAVIPGSASGAGGYEHLGSTCQCTENSGSVVRLGTAGNQECQNEGRVEYWMMGYTKWFLWSKNPGETSVPQWVLRYKVSPQTRFLLIPQRSFPCLKNQPKGNSSRGKSAKAIIFNNHSTLLPASHRWEL